MNLVDLGAILVAIIAALGAWAAQRSAAKASTFNTAVSGRLDAEKEAYNRARALDVETITRQDTELELLRKENETLRSELRVVKVRLRRLEHLYPEWERLLHERIEEQEQDDDPE